MTNTKTETAADRKTAKLAQLTGKSGPEKSGLDPSVMKVHLPTGGACDIRFRDKELADVFNRIQSSYLFETGNIVLHGDPGSGRTLFIETLSRLTKQVDAEHSIFVDSMTNFHNAADRDGKFKEINETLRKIHDRKSDDNKRSGPKPIIFFDDFDFLLQPPQSIDGPYLSAFLPYLEAHKYIVTVMMVSNEKLSQMRRHVFANTFKFFDLKSFTTDQIRQIMIDRLDARKINSPKIREFVDVLIKHSYYFERPGLKTFLVALNSFWINMVNEPNDVHEGFEPFFKNLEQAQNSASDAKYYKAISMASKFTEEEVQRGLSMSFTKDDIVKELDARVILKERNKRQLVNVTVRKHLGLSENNKPVAVVLALGQTGTGKTASAEALARLCYGSEDRLIRLDMNQFQSSHHINRIFGSAPGYVGYNEGTHLTKELQKKSPCVILFDEIEKAHPDIRDGIMNLLDEGAFTEGSGKTYDISKCIIYMTSNLGAELFKKKNLGKIGFDMKDEVEEEGEEKEAFSVNDLKEVILKEGGLRPEFLNRVDNILVFHRFSDDMAKNVARIRLSKMIKEVFKSITVIVTDEDKLIDYIYEKMNRDENGRSINRIIKNVIFPSIIDKLSLKESKVVEFSVEDIISDYMK
jgi:ATP-dependent Clp protease ATP-binding subunit ClpA